jgi:antitoxin (DNA-binding transcriptional repressor) of toxin-antitoxin stability system
MKTLTITDAKKNLSKWLQAAARGDDIGIISGADVIALRKVAVESADYAWREYGLSSDEIAAYEGSALLEHERLRRAGKLQYLTTEDLRAKGEKAARH